MSYEGDLIDAARERHARFNPPTAQHPHFYGGCIRTPSLPEPEPEKPLAQLYELELELLIRQAAELAGSTLAPLPAATVKDVVRAVAEFFEMTPDELLIRRRKMPIVRARQVAMYICSKVIRRTLPEIGRFMGGFDHTTVLHAARVVAERRLRDDRLRDEIQLIVMRLAVKFKLPPGALQPEPERGSAAVARILWGD